MELPVITEAIKVHETRLDEVDLRRMVRIGLEDRFTPDDLMEWMSHVVSDVAVRNGWVQWSDGYWSGTSRRRVGLSA